MTQYNKLELEIYRDDEKYFGMKIKLNASSTSYFSYAVSKEASLNHVDDVVKVISDYIKINLKNLYKEISLENLNSEKSKELGEEVVEQSEAS